MTLPIWPYTLPKAGLLGVSGGPQSNVLSFDPEIGPSIQRRRSSSNWRTYEIGLSPINAEQRQTFINFFDNLIGSGVKWFRWVDPMTDIGPRVKFTANLWTLRPTVADNEWSSVCWSPELGLFVAVAASGTGNRVMTSPDGITWTIRTSAADNNWSSVCWSPELNLFVAVANSGTGNRVMTSLDGITWVIGASAADNNWSSVCWSAKQGVFVAVAASGTGNRVMTSLDGITWVIGASAADNNWLSVCWADGLNLFVAVASSGTGNRVMTSANGIAWTLRASAADETWQSVVWAQDYGAFVAVGASGTGNRAMTSIDDTFSQRVKIMVQGGQQAYSESRITSELYDLKFKLMVSR